MITMRRAAVIGIVLLATAPALAQENIKILGVTMSPVMGGGFKPTGTELLCTAIDNGRCYDGKKWHDLFPPGPRKYATDAPDKVTCAAFVGGDCWTVDKKWYRMPRGQLMGVTMSPMSATPGAFVTEPLR